MPFFEILHVKKHIDRVHACKDKIYKCNICNKSFNTELAVTVHNKTHEGRNNYKYGLCDKFYSKVSNLKIHVKGVHEKLGKQKCESCGKSFQKDVLSRHISNVHEGQKDQCAFCGESFLHLKVHISKIHYGQKQNHKCDCCDKACLTSYTLKKHVETIHGGQKDHECG